jgi:DNA polymerase III delta prime subunit
MDKLDLNKILDRENIYNEIKDILHHIQKNDSQDQVKKGFYIYGNPGSGKTAFIISMLNEIGYDVIKYDAGDIRNKSIIETIAKHNMSNRNIMSMFDKKVKRIVIVMDEIDGMNNGDKGGITSLIKLVRPKKTKKQKLEESTINPIICIGNYHADKKIKELIKVCHTFELKTPNKSQMSKIVTSLMPTLDSNLNDNILEFIQGDLRKLTTVYNIYSQDKERNERNIVSKNESDSESESESNVSAGQILNGDVIKMIFQPKTYNEDSKQLTQKLFNSNYPIEQHGTLLNETDRTIVGLLWHENVIDAISKYKKVDSIRFYKMVLNNICFADYVDRITFQKQIWQFNEMSSLIKTFYNNKLYHEHEPFKKKTKCGPSEIRFTKVLTKYSTEYNNSLFIQNLCQQLAMDQKDMFSYFLSLRDKYKCSEDEIHEMLDNYDIGKLDISRIFRYLDKYMGLESSTVSVSLPAGADANANDIDDEL